MREFAMNTHVIEQKHNRDSARKRREDLNDSADLDSHPMEIDEETYPDEDAIAQLPNPQLFALMEVDSDDVPVDGIPTAELPPRFIFVRHHPHANKTNEIIPIDAAPSATDDAGCTSAPGGTAASTDRPWAPFRTYADFKFASRRIKRRSPNAEIDEDLRDLRDGSLARESLVTFHNHRDLEKALVAARVGNVAFECKTLDIEFEGAHLGGTYSVDVEFRDPWSIMKQWVCDPTLAPVSTWFSQERYLCLNGKIEYTNPLYDEPYTGETWRSIDDDLPGDGHFPSCFLGLHVWLDKGLVSTKVKMHPILLRGCWINSATRNGSGNGGSALAGFVKMPDNIRQIDPRTLNTAARAEYDQLKRLIYRGVIKIIFASLQERSHRGEALRFGDGIVRVGHPGVLIESMDFEEVAAWLAIRNSRSLHPCPQHPGVLIESMDFEEVAAWLAIRNSRSLHPCPQCLVHHDDLHRLACSYAPRTSAGMAAALAEAPTSSKAQRNEFLKAYGLHDFEHFLWLFAHPCPYKAVGYDCLHYFDGGIWGRHMWLVIKDYLQTHGLATVFNAYKLRPLPSMAQFPRWRNLKHLSSPTTIDYSDGQTFLDILKILPRNSPLIKLVREMQKVRTMLGLWVATGSRNEYTTKCIAAYGKISEDVSEKHDKSLNFLKQHFLSHAIENFQRKGTSRNMNTRVGEGFQQEVAAQYKKTNGKNAEHQISVMDENEEALARIQMAVDDWHKTQEQDEQDPVLESSNANPSAHWQLGSADPRVTTVRMETTHQGKPLFRDFNLKLRHTALPLAIHRHAIFVTHDKPTERLVETFLWNNAD
ncbi:hypothetical protein C8R47DRAFT_1293744 [Mycena vitilis]|nr:hypothetical protein C8R47DRAFT_1293744 [Mycena vitilis]